MKRLLIAVALLGVVVAGLLVPIPFRGRAASSLGDLVHTPLFCVLSLGALAFINHLRPLPSLSKSAFARYAIVIVVISGFGLAMEYAQRVSGRSASRHDAIANTIGVCMAVLVFFAWQRSKERPSKKRSLALFALALSLLGVAWWRPVNTLNDVWAAYRDFPLLGSFENKTELGRWFFRDCEGSVTQALVTHGSSSMTVTYRPSSHPSATMVEFNSDWSDMVTLELDCKVVATYPDDVEFIVKVVDDLNDGTRQDTYRGTWTLKPGELTQVRIHREDLVQGPDGRELDLSQIRWVDLMVIEPESTLSVSYDNLRLTLQ